MVTAAGVGGQHNEDIEPWLWLEVVDVDDCEMELILLKAASMGERLLLTSGEPLWLLGDVQPDEASELKMDENDGVGLAAGLGLTIGLGYGVKFKLLPVEQALLPDDAAQLADAVPYDGVGLAVRRPLHDGDGERANP